MTVLITYPHLAFWVLSFFLYFSYLHFIFHLVVHNVEANIKNATSKCLYNSSIFSRQVVKCSGMHFGKWFSYFLFIYQKYPQFLSTTKINRNRPNNKKLWIFALNSVKTVTSTQWLLKISPHTCVELVLEWPVSLIGARSTACTPCRSVVVWSSNEQQSELQRFILSFQKIYIYTYFMSTLT